MNNYSLIGFEYNNIINDTIFKKNKIDLSGDIIDRNFVDQSKNKINVYVTNNMNMLFENNFPINENIIYYFTLKDLLKLKSDIDDEFIYGVIYKYFPNVKKIYIEKYDSKENNDKRKEHLKIIKKNRESQEYLINIINKNVGNILKEQTFLSVLMNFKYENLENNINIIKLFSDFKLTKKIIHTKLILDDYKNIHYKIYKPVLKLKLSDEKNILDKNLCIK